MLQGVKVEELTPEHQPGQGSLEPSMDSVQASGLLPSCPEEAVNLSSSHLHAVCQPLTPQQSSESILASPSSMSKQPETTTLRVVQQKPAESDGSGRVTIPAGSAEQDLQHQQDTGGLGSQTQPVLPGAPGQEAERQGWMLLDRPHKSLPAHAFTAALKETVMAAPYGRQLSEVWRHIEDLSLPEEAPSKEVDCGGEGPLCEQEQLLRSLITRAGSLLRSVGEWGFDTIELAEVSPVFTIARARLLPANKTRVHVCSEPSQQCCAECSKQLTPNGNISDGGTIMRKCSGHRWATTVVSGILPDTSK